MKRKLLLLSTLLLAFSTLSIAQNTLTGFVLDGEQKGMSYANILLVQATDSSLVKGAITDSTGQYIFEKVTNGRYLVMASMMGFAPTYSDALELKGSDLNVPNMTLSESSVDMGQVTVTATKPFIEMRADKLIVNVAGSPVMAGNTALEVLRKSPGVTVDNNNNIILKGRQGVLVMINDKPTYLSMEEVARMLETMPASNIETIEIINNPSAKYDAAGNAGIINIKLKKDNSVGWNGNIRLGGGLGLYTGEYGPFEKLNGSLRLNYRQKKFNIFGNYNHWNSEGWNTTAINRIIPFDGLVSNFNQDGLRTNFGYSDRFELGMDVFATEKTIVGVLVKSNFGTWNNLGSNDTYLTGDVTEPFTYLFSNQTSENSWKNTSFNFNVKHDFEEGKTLSFDADYSLFRSSSLANYGNYYYDNQNVKAADDVLLKSDDRSDVDIVALKADYSHTIDEKTSLEAGAKSSFVTTDNGINFFEQNMAGDWLADDGRTNVFVYKENINAAYLNFNKQFEKIGLQAGLRVEHTKSLGESITLDTSVSRSYTNIFPSLSVSQKINDKNSMSYSYSRRIDRPTYQDLNPFLYFLDQYTSERGNPLLQPQFTDALSVTYGYRDAAFATLSYSRTNNAMTEIIFQDDSLKQTYQTEVNLATIDNFSLSLSSPIPIQKWWMMRLNLTTFYNNFQASFPEYDVDIQNLATNVYLSNNFTLKKGVQLELSGNYQSAMTYSIIQMKAQYGIDMGLNMPILDGKGRLSVNVNDVFNTRRFQGIIQQGNIDALIKNRWESRKVFLSFSYNFGNSKLQPNRRRSTATEDEQRRVDSGN